MSVQLKALNYIIQNYSKRKQNKIFWTIGQFEFEYFGDSDVMNKLLDSFHNFGNMYLLNILLKDGKLCYICFFVGHDECEAGAKNLESGSRVPKYDKLKT